MRTTDPHLGTLPEIRRERDALHIAVIPVAAAESLLPGDHVAIVEGRAVRTYGDEFVGVVDPFLLRPVEENEVFWLLLVPGTITSLRHDWTHPAFPPRGSTEGKGTLSASEEWLLTLAKTRTYSDYFQVLGELAGGGLCFKSERDRDWADEHRAEILHHFAVVTGKRVEGEQVWFSCAC